MTTHISRPANDREAEHSSTTATKDDADRTFSPDAANFTTQHASHYLWESYGIRRAPATLASLRVRGGGPRYRKDGANRNGGITYPRAELDAWAENRLRLRKTTAEA
jgi:hypothetical protein